MMSGDGDGVCVCVSRGQDSLREISDIKFSPDGATLAVASHDAKVYLYDVATNFSLRATCKAHHSAVLHIDFTADSAHLHTTSRDYELLYVILSQSPAQPLAVHVCVCACACACVRLLCVV